MQRSRLCDVAASGVLLTALTAAPVGMLYAGRYDPFPPDGGGARRTAYVALSVTSWAVLLAAAVPLGTIFVSTLAAAKAADGGSVNNAPPSAPSRTHLTAVTGRQIGVVAAAAAGAAAGMAIAVAAQVLWLASVFRDGWHGEAVFGLLAVAAIAHALVMAVRVTAEARYWRRVVAARGVSRTGSAQDLEDYTTAEG